MIQDIFLPIAIKIKCFGPVKSLESGLCKIDIQCRNRYRGTGSESSIKPDIQTASDSHIAHTQR